MHNSHVLYFDTSFTIGIYGVLHEQGPVSYTHLTLPTIYPV